MAKAARLTAKRWDALRAPKQMIQHVRECADARKLRLFACACCRSVWDHLTKKQWRRGVEIAERFADGEVADRSREAHRQRVLDTVGDGDNWLWMCAAWTLCEQDVSHAAEVVSRYSRSKFPGSRLQRLHADLVRCIFGNPFREVKFDKTWRTDTAVSLAKTMYDSRDFGAMPILADALQDAGCTDDHVLNHCRGGEPHARGCWVVDTVLGKA
jgi:hypothetical protein